MDFFAKKLGRKGKTSFFDFWLDDDKKKKNNNKAKEIPVAPIIPKAKVTTVAPIIPKARVKYVAPTPKISYESKEEFNFCMTKTVKEFKEQYKSNMLVSNLKTMIHITENLLGPVRQVERLDSESKNINYYQLTCDGCHILVVVDKDYYHDKYEFDTMTKNIENGHMIGVQGSPCKIEDTFGIMASVIVY